MLFRLNEIGCILQFENVQVRLDNSTFKTFFYVV